jgi:predicted  nucleic acid-binding Zn-ribbon protein
MTLKKDRFAMTTNAQKVVELEQMLKESRNRIRDLERTNADLTRRLQGAERAAGVAAAGAVALVGDNVALIHGNMTLQAQARLTSDTEDLKRRATHLQAENDALQARIVLLESENRQLEARVAQAESENLSLRNRADENERRTLAIEQELQRMKEAEEARAALLNVHDIIAGVKARLIPLTEALRGLDSNGDVWIIDDPTQLVPYAKKLSTTPDVIIALWQMNGERHTLSHTRVRSVDDMELLFERTMLLLDKLPDEYREAAQFVMEQYAEIIRQKKSNVPGTLPLRSKGEG